jgi:hypothetical protein
MRNFIYVLVLTILSCGNRQTEIKSSDNSTSTLPTTNTGSKEKSNKEICWTGTLNGKTPVFIHYQLDSNLIVGEITYLNTKDKLPIRLLGTIADDKSFRLLEFDKTGNITGIIEGTPKVNEFNGSWVSPRTKKELEMKLLPKDTLISSPSIMPDLNNIFGEYHYQYGVNGYSGDIKISKVSEGKAAFHILSLTNIERGPNIAEVEKDTIAFPSNNFIYKIPDSDDCEFKVTFYKGFAHINYTKGYCESQFGLNATIEGIYLKIK